MGKRIEHGALDWGVDTDGGSAQLQVDGHDIVSISDVRYDGTAHIIVWASSHPDSVIAWQGYVNVRERQDEGEQEDEGEVRPFTGYPQRYGTLGDALRAKEERNG